MANKTTQRADLDELLVAVCEILKQHEYVLLDLRAQATGLEETLAGPGLELLKAGRERATHLNAPALGVRIQQLDAIIERIRRI